MVGRAVSTKLSAQRRQLLKTLSLGGMAACLPYAQLARAQSSVLKTHSLSDDLLIVYGPDSNALALRSDEGIILMDGGSREWSASLLAETGTAFGNAPVRALFNSHWHPEQTGSNLRLGEQGVEIIAHENTRLWLGTEVWVRWSDIKYPPLPAAALPKTVFLDSGAMTIGGRQLEYGYMREAHTDGDIWIFSPQDNVLYTGGAISNEGWPIIDWWTGGWIGGLLNGYESLLAVANAETRIVPANGPLMTLAELQAQQQMYQTIFDRLRDMLTQSKGTEEVLMAKPTAEYDTRYGDSTLFVTLAFESLWGHIRDTLDRRLPTMP